MGGGPRQHSRRGHGCGNSHCRGQQSRPLTSRPIPWMKFCPWKRATSGGNPRREQRPILRASRFATDPRFQRWRPHTRQSPMSPKSELKGRSGSWSTGRCRGSKPGFSSGLTKRHTSSLSFVGATPMMFTWPRATPHGHSRGTSKVATSARSTPQT